MDKFELGDEVIINRDVAGMERGEVGTVIGHELAGLYVLKMRDGSGTYNILPEDLEHYVPDLETQKLRAAVDAAYRAVEDFQRYSENIKYNNYDLRPDWEGRSLGYKTASGELRRALDKAMGLR